MFFREVVSSSRAVAEVSSRNEKIARLADLLGRASPGDIPIVIAFLSGAPRQGRTGIGPALVWQSRGEPPAPQPVLTLNDVDASFDAVVRMKGAGSAAGRSNLVRGLFRRATADEQDFLARLLTGELRQGALEGVVVEAVARAAGVPADRVRRALMISGDLGAVARAALSGSPAGMDEFGVRLFQPVKPMLADSADGIASAVESAGRAAVEYKVDGARVQVHKGGDEVRVYTRHLREVTNAVPEIVEVVRTLPAREAILDGEVIALRPDGTPHPFQTTMKRFGRKLEIGQLRAQLPLSPFFFDLLYMDGEPLLDEPLRRRLDLSATILPAKLAIPRIVEPTAEQAEAFVKEALTRGHEGVMAKALDDPYAAGRRGRAWLKVKAALTLDLVVLAAEWGHGRRRGWLSNLHLGARDPQTNSYVMLGKTFKGLTDEMLAWQTKKFQELEIGRDDYTVYIRPEVVVEIAFNDLQDSPHYPGGLALRFARVKSYRKDKTAEEADTIETVRNIANCRSQSAD